MISERISDGLPHKIKKMNMVIPILTRFCSFVSSFSVASRKKPHVNDFNDVKQCPSRKYSTLSNQTSRYKIKCIRSMFYLIVFY